MLGLDWKTIGPKGRHDEQQCTVLGKPHHSYKLRKPHLDKIKALSGRRIGKLVQSKVYGPRRAFPSYTEAEVMDNYGDEVWDAWQNNQRKLSNYFNDRNIEVVNGNGALVDAAMLSSSEKRQWFIEAHKKGGNVFVEELKETIPLAQKHPTLLAKTKKQVLQESLKEAADRRFGGMF